MAWAGGEAGTVTSMGTALHGGKGPAWEWLSPAACGPGGWQAQWAGAGPCGRTWSSTPSRAPICCCSSCLAFTQVAMSCCRASVGTVSSGTAPLVRLRANSQTWNGGELVPNPELCVTAPVEDREWPGSCPDEAASGHPAPKVPLRGPAHPPHTQVGCRSRPAPESSRDLLPPHSRSLSRTTHGPWGIKRSPPLPRPWLPPPHRRPQPRPRPPGHAPGPRLREGQPERHPGGPHLYGGPDFGGGFQVQGAVERGGLRWPLRLLGRLGRDPADDQAPSQSVAERSQQGGVAGRRGTAGEADGGVAAHRPAPSAGASPRRRGRALALRSLPW